MCLWFPMYHWVGLLIVVHLLRSALEWHCGRLWYMAVSTGTVCPVAKGNVTNILVSLLKYNIFLTTWWFKYDRD